MLILLTQYFIVSLLNQVKSNVSSLLVRDIIITIIILINIFILVINLIKAFLGIAYKNFLLAIKYICFCLFVSVIFSLSLNFVMNLKVVNAKQTLIIAIIFFPFIIHLKSILMRSIDYIDNGVIYKLINFILKLNSIEKDLKSIFAENLIIEGYGKKLESYIKQLMSANDVKIVSKYKEVSKYREIFDLSGIFFNRGNKSIIMKSKLSNDTPDYKKKIYLFMKRNNIEIMILNKDVRGEICGIVLISTVNEGNIENYALIKRLSKILDKYIEKFTLSSRDIMYCLKHVNDHYLLEKSSLMNLSSIDRLADRSDQSKTKTLQRLLKECIRSFGPERCGKRTLVRIRYEILRMIAYENATESQIMWDLGFDMHIRSVVNNYQKNEPRYMYRSISEYSATSKRSFKRIKKGTIDSFGWRLFKMCNKDL